MKQNELLTQIYGQVCAIEQHLKELNGRVAKSCNDIEANRCKINEVDVANRIKWAKVGALSGLMGGSVGAVVAAIIKTYI